MQLVGRRVGDVRVLRLIRAWLKAGVMEEGKVTHPDRGSPQGGVISPLLSNVYLHEVDRGWCRSDGVATGAVLVIPENAPTGNAIPLQFYVADGSVSTAAATIA